MLSALGLLLVGHAALGGLAWGFLHVPESTVWMLTLSVLVALVFVALGAAIQAAALDAVMGGRGAGLRVPGGAGAVTGVVIAAALFGGLWLALDGVAMRVTAHLGEVHAWTLLRFGRRLTLAQVQEGAAWVFRVLKYVLALSLAIAFAALAVQGGTTEPLRAPARWGRAAFGWRALLLIALSLLVFVYLPTRWTYWRPRAPFASDTGELAFVAVKLAVLYLLVNIGWLLALAASAWQVVRSRSTSP